MRRPACGNDCPGPASWRRASFWINKALALLWGPRSTGLSQKRGHRSKTAKAMLRAKCLPGRLATQVRGKEAYCMVTNSPRARARLSERPAQLRGTLLRVAKLATSARVRIDASQETQGCIKALLSANDDYIFGSPSSSTEAGEVVTAVQTAMLAGLPFPRLRRHLRSPDHGGGTESSLRWRGPPL